MAALLTVDGVADAAVEPDLEGPGVVSLRLVDGADEEAVASSVDRLLRANFRLAAELDRVPPTPRSPMARPPVATPPAASQRKWQRLPAPFESDFESDSEFEGYASEGYADPEVLAEPEVTVEPEPLPESEELEEPKVLEEPAVLAEPEEPRRGHEDPTQEPAAPVAAAPASTTSGPAAASRPRSIPALASLTVARASAADELFARPRENHVPERAHHAVPHSATRVERRVPGRTRRGSDFPVQSTSSGRLSIENVQMLTAGFRVVASVRVSMDGRTYVGEAEGVRGSSARLVAAAALRAVEAAVDTRARFAADLVEFAGADQDQAVVCVVTMVSNGRTERLSGAVAVRDDIPLAVVQAVLAAVNRKVLTLLLDAS